MSSPSSQWASLPSSAPGATPSSTGNGDPNGGPYSGGGGGGGGGGGAPNTSLYLYTFLATLVILLSVSSCIIVRSFALRARRRRAVAAMLSADPTLLPPGWANGRYHPYPRKPEITQPTPVLWEIHVPPKEKAQDSSLNWTDIRPISALRPALNAPNPASTTTSSTSAASRNVVGHLRRYFFPPPPVPSSPASTPPIVSPPVVPELSNSSPKGTYTVSVIIAMPDAGRVNRKPYEEETPAPYVEVGVADLRMPSSGTAATTNA